MLQRPKPGKEANPTMCADPAAPRGAKDGRDIRDVPDATVARLPEYLRVLTSLAAHGVDSVSSEDLATRAGVRSTQLRKDLSHLGSYGVRGVGYDVTRLGREIARELGLTQDWPIAIVGMGNLGRALAAYSGFGGGEFRIVALLDEDPLVVGGHVGALAISPMAALPVIAAATGLAIGVIATPAASAQRATDDLIAVGVRSILNFAPTVLAVPQGAQVRRVDLSTELHLLAFHDQRKAVSAEGAHAGVVP
jgi:redox-sensing transcriptional repressor